MANYKDIKYQFPTSAVTSGTFADARISSSSVVQHSPETDLQPVKADITALALREATNEASAAFNLPNQFIETFTDDTNLGTQTTGDRTSGYWQPSGIAVTAYTSTSGGSIDTSSFNSIVYAIWGAGGGYCPSGISPTNVAGSGGDGGFVSGTLDTSSISTLYWIVGGAGGDHTNNSNTAGVGGTNGGGAGALNSQYSAASAGGGGYTGLFSSSTYTQAAAYAVAGGGGGNGDGSGGSTNVGCDAPDGTSGSYAGTTGGNTNSLNGTAGGGDTACKGGGGGGGYQGGTGGSSNNQTDAGGGGGAGTNFNHATLASSTDSQKSTHANSTGHANFDADYGTGGEGGRIVITAGAASATGTLIQSANTVASAKTKVGGVMFYKDNAGTATLGTDLKIYFSCNNGGAWTEAASYTAITPVYSTGIKQVRLGETTCTSGTGVIYKAVWANQADGSKETQLHGIGLNY